MTTYFLYDGGAPVVELGASGTVTAANGWGADGWRERASGSGFFAYAHDPNGSLLARVGSNNTTYPADDFSFYDAYGSLRGDVEVSTGRAVGPRDPMGFGGQFGNYTDVETGLVAMTHRYYDGGTGRFVNRDPIGYSGGINLYGFVGNNPVNDSDPSGLAPGEGESDATSDDIFGQRLLQKTMEARQEEAAADSAVGHTGEALAFEEALHPNGFTARQSRQAVISILESEDEEPVFDISGRLFSIPKGEGASRGGRLGGLPVRNQNAEIAAELKTRGYRTGRLHHFFCPVRTRSR